MRFLVAAVVAALSWPAIANPSCLPAPDPEKLAQAPYVAFTDNGSPWRFLNIPAVAPISKMRFLLGNFTEILLLDSEARTVSGLNLDRDDIKVKPAGLAYSPKYQVVFSADYLLNKVTVWQLDGERLTYLFEIGGLVSPEGAAFDDESGILSIAEYDGNGASAWSVDFSKGSAKKLWRQEVGQAHGIATMGGRVYVTGLIDRKIFVFDQASGKKLDDFGTRGWNPNKHEYLWPTSIYPDGRGNLVIADAETGFVSIVAPETKEVIATIGGARPGRGGFSQPYSAVVADDTLMIVSTKDERFVFIDYPSLCARESLVRDATDWGHYTAIPPAMKRDKGDYLWSNGPRISLFGKPYAIYSQALLTTGSEQMLRVGDVVGPSGYVQYKMLQYVAEGEHEYLFSPYAYNGPTIIHRRDARLYAVNFPSNFGRDEVIRSCWAADGIHCAQAEGYDLSGMRADLDQFINDTAAGRCASGLLTAPKLTAALAKLNLTVKWKEDIALPGILSSHQGKRFLALYEKSSCEAPADGLAEAGADLMQNPQGASLYEMSLASIVVPSTALGRSQ